MPAPGEQHRAVATATNPFEEVIPHINEYTAQEIATLQSRLEKQLGPEYISSRPGAAGQKVHYLAAEKCINLANEVFGFNGWSSSIQNVQIDFVDESQSTGKVSLGLSVIVRVTLRDGAFHEDIGYGHIENCKGKAAAFEKAKKEGTTDALKRALRNFGNILGNCIYDKDYLARVTKLKITPSKWDAENLHRHPDYAPTKKESTAESDDSKFGCDTSGSTMVAADDEFGGDEFEEADFSVAHEEHPDEVALSTTVKSEHFGRRGSLPKSGPVTAVRTTGDPRIQHSRPPAPGAQPLPTAPATGPQTPHNGRGNNVLNHAKVAVAQNDLNSHQKPQQMRGQHQSVQPSTRAQAPSLQPPQRDLLAGPAPIQSAPQSPAQQPNATFNTTVHGGTPPSDSPGNTELDPSIGFYNANALRSLQNISVVPSNIPPFNPHLDSPSIRKTAGIDHTKTKPVGREAVGGTPSVIQVAPPNRSNFVNPQTDQARRIGMPGGAASPLQNRNSYKPPQMMKRPADGSAAQYARPALNDVTLASVNVPLDSGADNKRQKIGNGPGIGNNQSVVTG
ncbi:DNA repair protein rad52 [Lignoscripta atroalba]|nr:DNA repair protein rad52 [Lignoscripta atroalba]